MILFFLTLLPLPVSAQTVVEMDLKSATQLLENHGMGKAVDLFINLANNYKRYTNIRVHSKEHKRQLAMLAKALRTDFDGSGSTYIPELNIWAISNSVGSFTYVAASLLDQKALLLSTDLDYMKGMFAYEILQLLQDGQMGLDVAQRKALGLGIEMQVDEREDGQHDIVFFGHSASERQLVGKLMVIEPPDFVW